MDFIIQFVISNWASISAIIAAVGLRLFPTEKNYDIFSKILKLLDLIVPNFKKGGGRHVAKLILFFVLASGYAELYAQRNVEMRQARFRTGVQFAVDTAATTGNEGNIWYDFVTGRYRANEGGTNKFLIGGSGGAYTAGNGLTLSGTEFKLGGSLTDLNTTLDYTGNTLTFTGGDALGGGGMFIINNIEANETVSFGSPGATGSGGFIYGGDYSLSYTARSLVDKNYVDNLYTASQGLTKTGTAFSLGGTVTSNIFINNDGTDNFSIGGVQVVPPPTARAFNAITFGAVNTLSSIIYSGTSERAKISMSSTGTVYTDNIAGISGSGGGIQYAGDYSANYTVRSLVDKAYADTKIDGTMAATRVPFGSDANTLTTDALFTYTTGTATLASPVATFSTALNLSYLGNNTIPFKNGAGSISGESQFTYLTATNQLHLVGTTGQFSTDIFGGEIQIDDITNSDDITINNAGISVTGLATPFDISSSSGLELIGNITITPTSSASQIYGGVYTPTLTAGANIATSTPRQFIYSRVGNTVTVDGTFDATWTTALTTCNIDISLPIASDLADVYDATGNIGSNVNSIDLNYVQGNSVSDRVTAAWRTNNNGGTLYVHFSYVIK